MFELLILVILMHAIEMSKTFSFVKKCVSLCAIYYMIVKNAVPLFSFSSIYFYFCLKK